MTDADALKCLMMPLESLNLLLPNVMVAEVIPGRKVEPLKSAPHWLLGRFEWCGLDIPLICFEGLCSTGCIKEGRGRIVVLYALSGHCVYGYYGLYMLDIPNFFSLQESDLVAVDIDSNCPYIAKQVEVNDSVMHIPNMSALEDSLNRYKSSLA